MKSFSFVKKYFLFLLLFCSADLVADEDSRFLISGNTGFTKDFSPRYFSTYWERGLNMGAGLGVKLGRNVVLQGTAEYHLFKSVKSAVTNGDGRIYSFLLNLKKCVPYNKKSSFIPFYKAGAGLLKLNTVDVYGSTVNEYSREEITELSESEKHRSVFSAAAGLGMDVLVNEDTKMNFEFLIVFGFDRSEIIAIVPLKLGVSVEL